MAQIPGFLKWAISILLTLTIITAGMMLWNKGMLVQNEASRQAAEQSKAIEEAQYSAFDNSTVSGSQILTAYRRYQNKDVFSLYVQTKQSGVKNFGMQPKGSDLLPCRQFNYTTGELASSGNSSCNITENDVTNVTSSNYIPPQARFKSMLIRDENDRVVAIYFKAY